VPTEKPRNHQNTSALGPLMARRETPNHQNGKATNRQGEHSECFRIVGNPLQNRQSTLPTWFARGVRTNVSGRALEAHGNLPMAKPAQYSEDFGYRFQPSARSKAISRNESPKKSNLRAKRLATLEFAVAKNICRSPLITRFRKESRNERTLRSSM